MGRSRLAFRVDLLPSAAVSPTPAADRPPPFVPQVDLRGATVSNPLHSPAAGSRSARILLRERDGRTHEMAAPSAAEAGAWVGGSVAHATASCERRLFTRAAL